MKNPDSIKPEDQLPLIIRHIKATGRFNDNVGAKFLVALFEHHPQSAYKLILRSTDIQGFEFTQPELALLEQVEKANSKQRDPVRALQYTGVTTVNRRQLIKNAVIVGGIMGGFGAAAHGITEGIDALDLPWHDRLEEWAKQESAEQPDWLDTAKEYLGSGAKIGVTAGVGYFVVNNLMMRFQSTREQDYTANMITGLVNECIQVHHAKNPPQQQSAERA